MSFITRQRIRHFSLALGALLVCCLSVEAFQQPNVVFVITDDQGYGDLACHGNPVIKTPELDRLYEESTRLTEYHVSPTCAPTRGALMSGHYTNRCGPWHTIMGKSFLFEGEMTLGDAFSKSGYATGLFGKWHLGDNYPFRPEDRGFTEVVRHGAGGVGQAPDYWNNAYFDDTYWHNGEPTKYSGYCSDIYFSEAKRFIAESKTAGKPFFAYISTNAPHGPFHCPDKYWKPYLEPLGKILEADQVERVAVFFGMIANIDENVGDLRNFLEEQGLAENTIFIFTTDNGTATGRNVFNAGMKGGKGSSTDGGHRVPFFVHWPDGGFTKGVDVGQLTAHIDVLPTMIELCDLKALPADYKPDGKSIVSILKDPNSEWADRTVITDSQRIQIPKKWKSSATMTERWRLVGGNKLYDIKADPGQENDVAAEYPEVYEKLRADYEAWWEDISPAFKRQARIVVGSSEESPSRLSSHDWLTKQKVVPWNQESVRAGKSGTGYWALRVPEAGTYRVTMLRWPKEAGKRITESVPAGEPVPGLTAYREQPGVALPFTEATLSFGEFSETKPVTDNDVGITFEVELPAGEVDLHCDFKLSNGKTISSYYAEVEKL